VERETCSYRRLNVTRWGAFNSRVTPATTSFVQLALKLYG
jgi:hypothetical protein